MKKGIYRAREEEYQSLRSFVKQLEKPEGRIAVMLADALERELTPRQREMVRLYYLEQHNMRDIAEMLGVYPSTVSRTLKLAREKLKTCLRYGGRALLSEGLED